MKYRPLNDAEIQATTTLQSKGRIPFVLKDLLRYSKVAYQTFKSSGFTVCIIKLPSGVILSGASRKSQKDKFNRVKGEMIAFVRTVTESRELVPEEPMSLIWKEFKDSVDESLKAQEIHEEA